MNLNDKHSPFWSGPLKVIVEREGRFTYEAHIWTEGHYNGGKYHIGTVVAVTHGRAKRKAKRMILRCRAFQAMTGRVEEVLVPADGPLPEVPLPARASPAE